MTVKTQIAKKVSGKFLVGNVANFIPVKEVTEMKGDKEVIREVPDFEGTTWLYDIFGLARTIKTGVSNYGDWVALMGDFYASPLVGDKVENRYRSGQLFLPDVALNLVIPVVEGLDKGAAVEVAFRVGINADADAQQGYVYTAMFLTEPETNDPLSLLEKKIKLPAPEKTAKVRGK